MFGFISNLNACEKYKTDPAFAGSRIHKDNFGGACGSMILQILFRTCIELFKKIKK